MASSINSRPAASLKAGTAKINITQKNVPVHDSTFVRVLILGNEKKRVAIISGDIIVYGNDSAVARLRKKHRLDAVMVCCSHTHSGRLGRDPEFKGLVENAMDRGLAIATKGLFDARVRAGRRSFPQLGYNRLIPRDNGYSRGTWVGDGKITPLNPERIPYGPVDPEVGVLKVDDLSGKTRAVIMNYACHSDVVANDFIISADYPGVAAAKVEEHYGHKAVCLFVQGGAGNIAPLFISSRKKDNIDFTQIEKMGKILADETIKVSDSLNTDKKGTGGIEIKLDTMHFSGRFDKSRKFTAVLATLFLDGNIAIATFPGEAFVYLEKLWKDNVDGDMPLFFGYTFAGGQWLGYVADIKSAAHGGFGADDDSSYIEIGAGEKIILKHLENLYVLKGITRDKPGPKVDWNQTNVWYR